MSLCSTHAEPLLVSGIYHVCHSNSNRFIYLFIYLFIYHKGPESGTDMPMIVNSKLTHYKIRHISRLLKIKDLKTDKLLKWCSSTGRQFHGLTTLSAKKTFGHIINTRQWLGRSLYAWPPGVMVTVSKSEKSSGFMSVRPKTILYVRIRSCRRRLIYFNLQLSCPG